MRHGKVKYYPPCIFACLMKLFQHIYKRVQLTQESFQEGTDKIFKDVRTIAAAALLRKGQVGQRISWCK